MQLKNALRTPCAVHCLVGRHKQCAGVLTYYHGLDGAETKRNDYSRGYVYSHHNRITNHSVLRDRLIGNKRDPAIQGAPTKRIDADSGKRANPY